MNDTQHIYVICNLCRQDSSPRTQAEMASFFKEHKNCPGRGW